MWKRRTVIRPFWQETSGTDGSAGRKNSYSTPLLVVDATFIVVLSGPGARIYLDKGRRLGMSAIRKGEECENRTVFSQKRSHSGKR